MVRNEVAPRDEIYPYVPDHSTGVMRATQRPTHGAQPGDRVKWSPAPNLPAPQTGGARTVPVPRGR